MKWKATLAGGAKHVSFPDIFGKGVGAIVNGEFFSLIKKWNRAKELRSAWWPLDLRRPSPPQGGSGVGAQDAVVSAEGLAPTAYKRRSIVLAFRGPHRHGAYASQREIGEIVSAFLLIYLEIVAPIPLGRCSILLKIANLWFGGLYIAVESDKSQLTAGWRVGMWNQWFGVVSNQHHRRHILYFQSRAIWEAGILDLSQTVWRGRGLNRRDR